ncbi:MAG: hypothetical protein N2596_03535 [Syntrophorhabdaceae bacterium]|nr:hypothetical protein [Syntrophorhabdaceae bacterium]
MCALTVRSMIAQDIIHCSEPQADFVKDKDRANYCEYFKFIESEEIGKEKKGREEAEKLWRTIFKKSDN